jgi:hypothetical protein
LNNICIQDPLHTFKDSVQYFVRTAYANVQNQPSNATSNMFRSLGCKRNAIRPTHMVAAAVAAVAAVAALGFATAAVVDAAVVVVAVAAVTAIFLFAFCV